MNRQFILFTILVFFTGLYLGTLRIVIPVIERHLDIAVTLSIFLPLVIFGFTKGGFNYLAGKLSDDLGRKLVLIIGWIAALSSIILFFYVNIYSIIIITVFLAINQALTWTTTVTSQIDISGKSRAGLASGINEMSGYFGVAVGNLFATYIFRLSYVFIFTVAIVALISSILAIDTKKLLKDPIIGKTKINYSSITKTSIAGLLEKFVDSSFFILIPTYLLLLHYSLFLIGVIVASYTLTWAVLQPLFGYIADISNQRRLIITIGFFLMFLGFFHYTVYPLVFSIMEGIGMSMIYPNLIALVNDEIHESVRGKALGYYRLYRDSGYGVAGLILPLLYSFFGFNYALLIVGTFQLISIFLIIDVNVFKHVTKNM